jgi:hypothetical protein
MPFVNAGAAAAGAITPNLLEPGLLHGRLRHSFADFTLATDVPGTYTAPIRLPVGARVITGYLNTTVTLGASATLAVGIAGAVEKYRAAATFTAANALTFLALMAATGPRLTAEEQIILTTAVANLPASGTLRVGFIYVLD